MKTKIKKLLIFFVAFMLIWGGTLGLPYYFGVEKTSAEDIAGIVENFNTMNLKDHANYSAFWDTKNGEVSLHAQTNSSFTTWNYLSPTPQGHQFLDVSYLNGAVLAITNLEMFRSTDGGVTWSTVDFGVPGLVLSSIYGAMGGMGQVYVSGFLGGQGYVIKSFDAGATWSTTDLITMTVSTPKDLYFFTNQNGVVVGSGGQVVYTTDGGASWTAGVSGVATVLQAVHGLGMTLIAVGGSGFGEHTIIRSTDGGATWSSIANPATNPLYDVFCNAFGGNAMAVGADGLFLSVDGGLNWAATAVDPTYHGTSTPVKTVWGGGAGAPNTFLVADRLGQIHKTTDAGANWNTFQSFPSENFSFYIQKMDFDMTTTTGYAFGNRGVMLTSSDGGLNWSALSSQHITDYALPSISCFDKNNCLTVGDNRVGVTTDSGSTWTQYENPNDAFGVNYYSSTNAYRFSNTSEGKIYSTTNGGVTWALDNTGVGPWDSFYDMAALPNYGQFWIAGDNLFTGAIYKRTGGTWTAQSLPTLDGSIINAIYMMVDTSTDPDSFVGYAVSNWGDIIKTTDGGDSWVEQTTGTWSPFTDIYCYNLNTCFVAKTSCGDGDYLYTTNGGTTWSQGTFPRGGGAACDFERVIGLDGRHVMFLSQERLYYTDDGGSTWHEYSTATPPLYPYYMRGMDYASSNRFLISTDSTSTEGGSVISVTSPYGASQYVQSIKMIDVGTRNITSGTLTASETLNGQTIDYYLSADGGLNWESVTNGAPHVFVNQGSDLRWKAVLSTANPAVTPYLLGLSIDISVQDEGGGYTPPTPPVTQCNDGSDNDGDGKIDFGLDLGCTSGSDNDESGPYQCSDSVDNDGDLLTDYPADTGCTGPTDDDETGLFQCSDTIDNDSDGKADYPLDPGCTSSTDNTEAGEITESPVITEPANNLITKNNKPIIKGTTVAGSMTVDIYIDAVKATTLISTTDKNFEYTPETSLSDGIHEIYAKSENLDSTKISITVDTLAPQAPLIDTALIKSQALNGANVDVVFQVSGQSFGDTKYVPIYLDNIFIDNVEPVNGSWTYEFGRTVAPGTHKITAKALDFADNLSLVAAEKDVEIILIEKKLCENGLDDDNDNVADFPEDPGCSSPTDDTEDSEFIIRANETRQLGLTQGFSAVNMFKGGTLEFKILNVLHTQRIQTSVAGESTTFVFQSDPQEVSFSDNQTKSVDVDADGVKDVEVKLMNPLSVDQSIFAIRALPRPIIIPEEEPIIEKPKPEPPVEPPVEPPIAPPVGPDGGGVAPIGPDGGVNPPVIEEEGAAFVPGAAVEQVEDFAANVISSITQIDIATVKEQVQAITKTTVETARKVQSATIDNPVVEQVNDTVNAPVMAVTAATSVAAVAAVGTTGVVGANLLTYLQFLISQLLMFFSRRKRAGFGMVYNSVTKRPIDLAVVRVFNAETKAMIGTKVTDKQGRFQFILKPGKYNFVVERRDFKFPSNLLQKAKTDGNFRDLYYGETIEVTEQGAVSPIIAIDPDNKLRSDKMELRTAFIRKTQFALVIAGPILALTSYIIHPHWWVLAIGVSQVVLYFIFKRLGVGEKPKAWGIVRDADEKAPLTRSIIRVFDTKFNKLLETQVADSKGRYAFLVGNQKYYLTADKAGYFQKRTDTIDLTGKESGYLAENFALKKHNLGEAAVEAQEEGKAVTIRTELGRLAETEIGGIKKVVRPAEQKMEAKEVGGVDMSQVHEDYYQLDAIAKSA